MKPNGEIKISFFRDNRHGTSCDLARFSTREKSRRGHSQASRRGADAGLVEFSAADVRSVGSDVHHRPHRDQVESNYAHAELEIGSSGAHSIATENARLLIAKARFVVTPGFKGKA
ncbi:MAG: hypothetical protein A2289_25255 [Deltaproteobacteria bacterium RIFOXYA12_FULL_58_15]|nr:MAG: hypothetical protein A2289_25255 [Deltaproteobacteria bacterium RIFOXYA12_FULL_58_15]OGR14158.1 MAG: hypothetical protein A2341_26625 [Deltaproteobacteria bacterium RIFOXYB12_FULL_58_9]